MKQNVTVKNVIDDGDGFSITSEEGNLFFLSKEKAQGKVPKVGDIITLHTYGGCFIRGMDINSVPLYYKTDEELKQDRQKEKEEERKRREERFKELEPELNKLFALLPKILQHRIEMFRKFSPDFRVEDELYELSSVFLGSKIYHHCKANNLEDFEANVDKFDVSKYIKTHWFLSKIGVSSNQVAFAEALAVILLRDEVENKINIKDPTIEELLVASSMRMPDALSPLRTPLCWPRENFIKDYTSQLA